MLPEKYDPPGGDKTFAMDMDTGWYKYADESGDEDSDDAENHSDSSESISTPDELRQSAAQANMQLTNTAGESENEEEYDDSPPPPPPNGSTPEEQKQAQSLWGTNATAVNLDAVEYTKFKNDFTKRSLSAFTKILGGNNVQFARRTFEGKVTQVKYFVNTHVKKNIPLLHKSILYGARYNPSYKLLYLSMCWYRRPNQTYMFVFTLLRTKCTTPNDEYIYMDEKTQRIRWITDLNTLKSCEPDMSKPFNIVAMTDKLNTYLKDQNKFHDPERGPNLKENGYVDEIMLSRDRRRPDPPSPPIYKQPVAKEASQNSASEISAGKGGGRGGRGGRGRGGRSGRGGRGRIGAKESDSKPASVQVVASATRSKRGKEVQDVVFDTEDLMDISPNEESGVIKKKKVDDGSPSNVTNRLNLLYARVESMTTEHNKEIERIERRRLSDIASLLEKQAVMEREIELYKTKNIQLQTTAQQDISAQTVPQQAPLPQATPQQYSLPPVPPTIHQQNPLPPASQHIPPPHTTPHCFPPSQNTPVHFVSHQITPQYAVSQQQPGPQAGVSLSQYVATLRSLNIRGDEHNLLLNVLRERDILESSIATFGNLTFPPPK